jgi:hypothetical protein
MGRSDDQVNIRLSPEDYGALAAAAFVRGLKSPAELARTHVEELAQVLAADPAVAMAMDARAMHQAQTEGRLSHLPTSKSVEESSSGTLSG